MTPSGTQKEVVNQTTLFEAGGHDDILAALAGFFYFSKDEIEEHTRRAHVVEARHMIMYLLREYGDVSFPAIGRLIGGRDHTTVIHAYNKIKKEVAENPSLVENLTGPIALVEALKAKKLRVQKELEEMNARLYAEALDKIRITQAQRKSPRVRSIPERNLKVLDMYREGLTLRNISSVFGLSTERIRQIVLSTIQYLAINESLTKGIVMDMDVLFEEEEKKRQVAKNLKKPVKVRVEKVKRWGRYYEACRECGLTNYAHVRGGLCERCINSYRKENREKIITEHGAVCAMCGISRPEAFRTHGRDFYILKDQTVLCRGDFLEQNAQKLGHYKHHEWSRHYPACVQCGKTDSPHALRGLCVNCSGYVSPKQREAIIVSKGNVCDRCGMSRDDARKKYNTDFRLTKAKDTLCFDCFQKYIRTKQQRVFEGRMS